MQEWGRVVDRHRLALWSALRRNSLPRWAKRLLFGAGLLLLAAALIAGEMESSWLQARYFAGLGRDARFHVEPGVSPKMRFPNAAPYDQRLGYSEIPALIERLGDQGYVISAQARLSPQMLRLSDRGLFLPYHEKSQAGLTLLDCKGLPQYAARFPQRVFGQFESVPRLLVDSLLYIENRELLDERHPTRNPAVEWDRLGKAVIDQLQSVVDWSHPTPGGSTLATQIEKYRHSEGGLTASIGEKLRQMSSASVRAYLDGKDTRAARRQILVDYLDTMPLAARRGYGEVHGLGDGLWAWYGRDFAEAGRLLQAAAGSDGAPAHDLRRPAELFKQALSLMIAQRRPSYYLGPGVQELEQQTNSYLRLLAGAGVVSPQLRDAALQIPLSFHQNGATPTLSFVAVKAPTALRSQLSGLLGVPRLYDLDRFDLTATSSFNRDLQGKIDDVLQQLKDPRQARAKGLYGHRLLSARDDPAKLIVSFTLFERGDGANHLRVQTDNFDQPFDLNQGARLDLGSTAKLRTLISYLEVIADLHARYAHLSPAALREVPKHERDVLSEWALAYLAHAEDKRLTPMLEASMDRRYSASPWESFYTGGGLHTFANFNPEDDERVLSLREGLRRSVNLVFIRAMRDLVRHHVYRPVEGAIRLLEDVDDPRRGEYLARFADREGRVFLARFYRKYRGKTVEQAEELLLERVRTDPRRYAVVLRSLAPEARQALFDARMRLRLPGASLTESRLRELYQEYAPEKFSLADRGYLAGVHPLELWLVAYLRGQPDASLAQAIAASRDQRLAVYGWLFRSSNAQAQNNRIQTLLELEAFQEIGASWRRLGYPFESLTPSYASAIGASGDRPAALAELMGIIVNDGLRLPTARIESIRLAPDTPFETQLDYRPAPPQRLLPAELAQVVRRALLDVVEEGTAQRLKGAFTRADGTPVAVGGKTGTGDHRFEVYGPGGRVISSRVINRSATFVFMIDDRYFGTLTAYVAEPYAARYVFTSTLPVQLLTSLAGDLMPLVEKGPQRTAPACGR